MRPTLFCDITQRTEVIHYRRFGTNYRYPSSKFKKFKSWISEPWSQLILSVYLDGLLLSPLNTGCTRSAMSTFNGKINTFDITDINSFFVHIKYWKIFSLSFDWLYAITSLSICLIRKQTTAEISSTFCHHLDTTKKSRFIKKNVSFDRSSSHRASF